jgi:hypothetical protein
VFEDPETCDEELRVLNNIKDISGIVHPVDYCKHKVTDLQLSELSIQELSKNREGDLSTGDAIIFDVLDCDLFGLVLDRKKPMHCADVQIMTK